MELLQLRYFILAARLENITQASHMLKIPQPALSSTIKRLEKELGHPLFDRKSNRVSLNESGKRYLKRIESAIQLIDDAKQEIRDADCDELSGDINLLILTNRRVITEYIIAFNAIHHNINFHIAHDNHSHQSFDLYIIDVDDLRENMCKEQLIEEELLLAVHQDHRLAKQSKACIRELRHENIITMPPDSSLNCKIKQACIKEGFYPTIHITCDDPLYIRRYVAEGLGVSLIPSYSWKGLFDERIVLLTLDVPVKRRSVIAWNSKRYMSKAVQSFRDYILDSIRDNKI